MNLTVTIEKLKNGAKRRIYSNFEWINKLICLKKEQLLEKKQKNNLQNSKCQIEFLCQIISKLSNLGYSISTGVKFGIVHAYF